MESYIRLMWKHNLTMKRPTEYDLFISSPKSPVRELETVSAKESLA